MRRVGKTRGGGGGEDRFEPVGTDAKKETENGGILPLVSLLRVDFVFLYFCSASLQKTHIRSKRRCIFWWTPAVGWVMLTFSVAAE